MSDDLIINERVPAPPHCEHCARHEEDKAELASALTLLYTWASLGQVLPSTIQDPVKQAFKTGVTPIVCKVYEERVKMRNKYMEEQEKKKTPEPAKPKKLLSTEWRGWKLLELPELDERGRSVFRYTSPDGSIFGKCHDAKGCKKDIDKFVAEQAP